MDPDRDVDAVTDDLAADEPAADERAEGRDASTPAATAGPAASPASPVSTRPRFRVRIAPFSLLVGLIVVALDQITKHWAVNDLADGREIHVIWTLQWNLSFNTGMAFSKGEGLGPIIALLALLIVIVLIVSSAHVESKLARFAAGLLIGGALGNLLDRLFRGDGWLHGAVVDFIDFQWFPIFNVADIGVTCGAVLFALASLFEGQPERRTADTHDLDRAADGTSPS